MAFPLPLLVYRHGYSTHTVLIIHHHCILHIFCIFIRANCAPNLHGSTRWTLHELASSSLTTPSTFLFSLATSYPTLYIAFKYFWIFAYLWSHVPHAVFLSSFDAIYELVRIFCLTLAPIQTTDWILGLLSVHSWSIKLSWGWVMTSFTLNMLTRSVIFWKNDHVFPACFLGHRAACTVSSRLPSSNLDFFFRDRYSSVSVPYDWDKQ